LDIREAAAQPLIGQRQEDKDGLLLKLSITGGKKKKKTYL